MRSLTSKVSFVRIVIVLMMALMAMPAVVFAKNQGRGRGRGRDFDRLDRKCEKFVNCHDARDGRWDGRGPRRASDDRFRRRRFRDRDFDDDDFRRFQRRRFRNRDFDNDDFRRRRRILNDRYRNQPYYDDYNNPYNRRGADWFNLLNLFLQ